MSIKITSKVWDYSRHTGTALLAMLALSDHANDDGYCWPGMASIAHKVRVKERQCVNVIQTLEASGEVFVDRGVGRKGTSKYLIVLGLEVAEIAQRLITYFDCPKARAIPTAQTIYVKVQRNAPLPANTKKVQFLTKKVQPATQKGATAYRKGAIAIAPEPSLTVNEPSEETSFPANADQSPSSEAQTDQPQAPEGMQEQGTSSPLQQSPIEDDVPPAPPKSPRPRNLMFDKITAMTHTTPAMAGKQIGALIKRLKADGYDETHLDLFAAWWCQDWRSKSKTRGDVVPTIGQIGQLFGVAMAWAEKHAPKPALAPEPLTPEDEADLEARLEAERQAQLKARALKRAMYATA